MSWFIRAWPRLMATVLLAALLPAVWLPAQAAQPLVRVNVQARQPVLVGQQVKITVGVLAPNYFTSAPPFPPLKVDGAIVTMPDESSEHSTETVGGASYARIQKTYVFAAQQEGEFALPPVKITFTYGGDDGKPRPGAVTLPPTKIVARLPAGAAAAGGGATLPVARVTIVQGLDPAPEGARRQASAGAAGPGGKDDAQVHLAAGDALVRTVRIFAAQTQAMMIPPPHFDAPAGVRVFAADPQLEDETKERVGFIGGHRTDRVTYVFEKPGRYTLPAVDIGWFDAAANKAQTAEAPAVSVLVRAAAAGERGAVIAPQAASAASAAAPGPRLRFSWRVLWTVVAAALALATLVWLWRRFVPGWRAASRARRAARAVSDDLMFHAVLDACRADDAPRAYQALLLWARRHAGGAPRAWGAGLGDERLAAAVGTELSALERALYAGAAGHGGASRRAASAADAWDGSALASALAKAHRVWSKAHDHQAGRARALPPLNPVASPATRGASAI